MRQRWQPGKWTRADGEEGWDPAFILKVQPTGFPGRVDVSVRESTVKVIRFVACGTRRIRSD